MYVIGTAGHVDHGKSTLVEALTGINPDRLKEERERQMTIDLGFAWLTLPAGETVGVVDVPGHRDFIENMLAGVGGIDAALLVIAADEGLMPQTREHLAILDLLRIPSGVIVLTKTDLVEPEWLTLVQTEVRAAMPAPVWQAAPLVAVSARTGAGLAELKTTLQTVLAACPPRSDRGRPRLAIDRVFTVAGFGAVVTGTLSDGVLTVGDEVEILPQGLPARVRGLQTHKAKIERAMPGSRVAINLAGVELPQLHRGQVVAHPATLTPSTLLDVRLQHLPDTGWPLKNGAAVKLFSGAAEVPATARVLGGEVLAPGETGWVQLVLTEPVVVLKGDRFILRRPSPGATIAGGEVIDPHPRRHRRRDAGVLARLETLARGTPGEMLQQALETLGLTPLPAAAQKAGLEAAALAEALAELQARGDLIQLEGETLVVARSVWTALADSIRTQLMAYHAANPLRTGMPREELKSRLTAQRQMGLTPRGFQALLAYAAETGRVVTLATLVRLPDHVVRFSPAQTAQINRLLAEFQRQPYSPPSLKECVAGVGEEVLNALVEQGQLVPVSAEVLFLAETYARLVERLKAHLQAKGKITVAEVRDLFNTSRKYALALMEHLDTVGVTRRVGDERVLR